MLRIDETSKTLVAPEATAYVPDRAPSRDELNALISGGWDAFAGEIGQPQLKAVAAAPEAGADILAMDRAAGRAAVVIICDCPADEALARALAAAAAVSGWDADRLGALHEDLQAATPGDSPRIIIVGAHFDAASLVTCGWLVGRHGLKITAYGIEVLRHGSERMMNIVPTFPARGPEPEATAGFVAHVDPADSTPPPVIPPGLPAPPA